MSKQKLTALFQEYGPIAIGTYLVIFAVVLTGFAIAIASGFNVEGAASGAGTIGAAWLATKLTQPIRILATLALTPIVARVVRSRRATPPGEAA